MGPHMTSDVFQKSLKAWGVRHCLSAAYNPHSNCRAEIAVKTGKRLLRDNVGHGGSLNTDRLMRAVMQFRNTPMQDCRRSPAQMVFGRAMRDFIPSLPHKYEPAKDWAVTQEYRERTMAMKREADREKWSHKTKDLEMLEIGTPVMIQNQTGNNPTKWDKTGVVLENKPHSQVLIRVDGSRRVTLRNRRFVKKLDPGLKRMPNPVTVQPKPVKKAPAQKKIPKPSLPVPEVQEEPPVPEVPDVPLGAADERDHHDEVHEWVDEQVDQAGIVDEANTVVHVPADHPVAHCTA